MIEVQKEKRQNINVRTLLVTLYRRKFIAIGFLAFTVAGGYIGLRAIPPVYRATAQLMLHLGQEDVFMPVLPSSSSEVRTPLTVGGLEHQTNSEIRIITSTPLTEQVVAKFGREGLFPGIDDRHPWYTPKGMLQLTMDTYRQVQDYFYPASRNETSEARTERLLGRKLNANAIKDSTVIEVTMDNSVPEIAAESLNELLRLYLLERPRIYQQQNDAFFGLQLSKLSTQLDDADRQLAAFRSQHDVVDVEQQRDALLHRLTEVSANLQNEVVLVDEMKKRIHLLEGQLEDTATIANAPILRRIRDDLLKAQSELGPHQNAAANWSKIHADLTKQVAALTDVQSESAQLVQRLRVLQDARKLYLQKIEEMRVQQSLVQAHLGNVSVINWASIDHVPVSPKFGLVLGGIAAVGIFGGIGLALLIGLMDDTIRNVRDVVESSGLPVIGQVRRLTMTRRLAR